MTPEQENKIAVGVPVIILDESGRILLVKRAGRSYEGMWGIPSETLQPGETIFEAAIRGMREELGVEVEILGYYGAIMDGHNRDRRYKTAIDIPVRAKIIHGDPQPLEEASSIGWFPLSEVGGMDLPYDQHEMLFGK